MDAIFKQRVKKAAITYVFLTVACGVWVGYSIKAHDAIQQNVSLPLFYVLQPIFYFFEVIIPSPSSDLSATFFGKVLIFGLCGLAAFSIFPWALFVGWIFIQMKDWLNHFPVLGKRVF